MIRPAFILLLIIAIGNGWAQKAPIKFGTITPEELRMKYEGDTSAAAVVLVDFGESTIQFNTSTGFELYFERTRRIKILKKEGLEWADFVVPLYKDGSRDEKISGLKGVTFNLENGKVTESKLKNDGIFRENSDIHLDLVKVTMPNVREGSVIDLTYKVRSEFLVNFQDWDFQTTIPVLWSEYRAAIPEYFTYNRYAQGYLPMAVNETSQEAGKIVLSSFERSGGAFQGVQSTAQQDEINFKVNKFRWAVQNAPAFRSEPFMTTSKDYVSKMNFELESIKMPGQNIQNFMGSWEEISKTYSESEDFGKVVTGNGFLKKTVEDLTANAASPQEKIGAIVNYVKQNITWDGAIRKFPDKSLRKVLDDKKGNSAEVNLLLASMIEKTGMQAYPLLISTRDHGFVREFIPVSTQFNAVACLARWEGGQMLVDGTEALLPAGALPERYLNGRGLLVSSKGFEWVKLEAPGKSRAVVTADLSLSPDGALSGTLQFEYFGYQALEKRKAYLSKGEGEYVKALTTGRSWELKKSEFQNVKEINLGFKEKHEIGISDHITTAADVMYINPFITHQQADNPFKLEKREYPVDFGSAYDVLYMAKFTIPDGYQVEEMPQSKFLTLPSNAARYVTNISLAGNVLSYMGSLSVNKATFAGEEYPNLREFFNQVVSKQSEQVVIKKK